MERAIVVRGRLSDERHLELDEAVADMAGELEVVIRRLNGQARPLGQTLLEFIAAMPPGIRTKEDIDAALRIERESWGDR